MIFPYCLTTLSRTHCPHANVSFALKNVKKKHKFQAKLKEIHEHQKIKERVLALAKDFERLTIHSMSSIEMISLVARYQLLDTKIQVSIKAAADSVGQKTLATRTHQHLQQQEQQCCYGRLYSRACNISLSSQREWAS